MEYAHGTGYVRDEASERDWLWDRVVGAPLAALPSRFSYESVIGPAFDQGPTQQCVAYAISGLKRYHEYKESARYLSFDPVELYARCKTLDGIPNREGTYIRVAMDVLRTEGMRAAETGEFHTAAHTARLASVGEIKHALVDVGPVVIGVRLDYNVVSSLSGPGAVLSAEAEGLDGGHAMLVVGYDDAQAALRVRNSWGFSWGEVGHCWLPYAYLESVDPEFDAWSVIDEVAA